MRLGERDMALPRQARVLLGVLLLRANEVVSAQRLADEIWGERPPASWINAVQVYVSRVRKALAEAAVEGALVRHGPGYVLEVASDGVDWLRFERLSREAAALAASDPAAAAGVLREALGLWRGPVLDGLTFESLARVEVERLQEARLVALMQRVELDLTLGLHREVVPELEQLVAEHPLWEGLRCQLVLALYRSGRQADALAECRQTRRLLVDELGLEPSEELRRLERSVLQHDPAIAAPAVSPTAEPGLAAARARRPVTAVSVTVAGPGLDDLDEELVDSLQMGAGQQARAVLEQRGALIVEAGAGTLVGLFGLPAAHEDDALRACRAALIVRDLFGERSDGAGVDVGVAVESGDVVVGDGSPRGGLLQVVTRLAGLAGSVVLGPRVQGLVGEGVSVRTEDDRVCLVAVRREAEAIPRDLARPLVGRETELDTLRRRVERSLQGDAALIVVSGPAGIGKSRVVAECAALSDEAAVLRTRCLPDEAGVAYAPLRELAGQLLADRGRRALLGLVATEDDPDEIIARFLVLVDPEEEAVSTSREETFRAVWKVFEALARERPLLLVVEDLHWAEPVFLDLLEQIATLDSPIAIVGTARPRLLRDRPAWAAEHLRCSVLAVGPLPPADCDTLLASISSDPPEQRVRARIVEASGGNPLFLEQLAVLDAEWASGAGAAPVPASLRGLLLARLDTLSDQQRALLEVASILLDTFSVADLDALSPTEGATTASPMVEELVQRGFLRAAGPPGVHSFEHPLIRTTVYETLPKRRRAELHERYADVVEKSQTDGAPDELIGHHLERAFRARLEVTPGDTTLVDLAGRARERLTAAGLKRYGQGDVTTAVSLLGRARDCATDDSEVPAALHLDLGEALREIGRLDAAETELDQAIAAAAAAGDDAMEWRSRASLVRLLLQVPGHSASDLRALADLALSELTRLADNQGLALAWWVQGWLTWLDCRAAETERALAKSIEHARLAGNSALEANSVNLYLGAALFGPMPVTQAIERCRGFRRRHHDRQRIVASSARALAVLHAMQGDFDEARALAALDRDILTELGMRYQAAAAVEAYGLVELLADEPERAEHIVRGGYEQLERIGDTNALPTIAALLGETLVALERYEEAVAVTDHARKHADPGDLGAQVQWRCAHAKALVRRGRDKRALRLSDEAVQLAQRTDFTNLQADALTTLAEVHRLQRRTADTTRALIQAAELYKSKGNLVAGARTDVQLRASRLATHADAAANVG